MMHDDMTGGEYSLYIPRRKRFAYARACAELTLAYVLQGFLNTSVCLSLRGAYAELTLAYVLHGFLYTLVNVSLRGACAELTVAYVLHGARKLKPRKAYAELTLAYALHGFAKPAQSSSALTSCPHHRGYFAQVIYIYTLVAQ